MNPALILSLVLVGIIVLPLAATWLIQRKDR